MTVYDCDDADQYQVLADQIDELIAANQLSTFAPDTEAEARNRGFHPQR